MLNHSIEIIETGFVYLIRWLSLRADQAKRPADLVNPEPLVVLEDREGPANRYPIPSSLNEASLYLPNGFY